MLVVDAKGFVAPEALDEYLMVRREEVGGRLASALADGAVATSWLDCLSEKELHADDGEGKYLGDAASEAETKAALARVKVASSQPRDIVAAIENLILCFCGFDNMKPGAARCIVNALHFQYRVDVDKFLGTSLSLPSAEETPTDAEKALFDDARLTSAELLLRVVVETSDGGRLANPFSPGAPMGKLLKLPLFAQFVMVLTNAVEAKWYQEALPQCPMAINLYASLLVADAPVRQMTSGVAVVEIMEMTKGAKRGAEVDEWVRKIRESGSMVMLDDFDAKHPGVGSQPDGIKVSVFLNAFHSLQAFKNLPVGEKHLSQLLPIADMRPVAVPKEKIDAFDFLDFYRSLVPQFQGGAKILVMEGSENCLKSERSGGSPLNFDEPKATTATAHVYQAAARAMLTMHPAGFHMVQQGGRALYADEDFDEDALAVIAAAGKPAAAARAGDAGTIAWMGQEAVRRAAMQVRPLVCGVVKKSAA